MGTALCLIRGGTRARGHFVHQYQPAPVSAQCPHLPSPQNTFKALNKTSERKLESFWGQNSSFIVALVNYGILRVEIDTKDTEHDYLLCKCIPF